MQEEKTEIIMYFYMQVKNVIYQHNLGENRGNLQCTQVIMGIKHHTGKLLCLIVVIVSGTGTWDKTLFALSHLNDLLSFYLLSLSHFN